MPPIGTQYERTAVKTTAYTSTYLFNRVRAECKGDCVKFNFSL
jgi:hypothetical protein